MGNAIEMMESTLSPDALKLSRAMAAQEIFVIKLNRLREQVGAIQAELDDLCQQSTSQIESWSSETTTIARSSGKKCSSKTSVS
ncbi:MAG: hypothetical protein FWC04_04915 [Chitinispirillia bacterium]|nr:hypothetical protein [Chitinispirillia bacterium]